MAGSDIAFSKQALLSLQWATSDPRDPLFAKPMTFNNYGRKTHPSVETRFTAREDARPPRIAPREHG